MNKRYEVRSPEAGTLDEDGEPIDLDDGCRSALQIVRNGKALKTHYDGREPEDCFFYRDFSWIFEALEQAYQFGLEDGRKEKE